MIIRFILLLLGLHCTSLLFSQALSGIVPKHQAFEYSLTPTFEWNEHPQATEYVIELSQDPTFAIITVQSPALVATSWTSTILTYGEWYWRVKATVGSETEFSSSYSLTLFSPSELSSVIFWIHGNQGVSLDVNGKVETLTDVSPNAYQLTQPNEIRRPVLTANGFNNHPAFTFSGNQFLNGGDILDIGTESRTMYVVGNMASSNQSFVAKSIAGAAGGRYAIIKDGLQSAYLYEGSGLNQIYSPFNTNNYALYKTETSRIEGRNRFSINNNLLGNVFTSTTYNMQTTYRFLIGAYSNATDNGEILLLTGNISEMIFLNSVDAAENNSINQYLRYKYTPPINLGKDTTSTSFCPIDLTAPAGFTNLLWSTGETSSTITVNESGNYWVRGTDLFGFVSFDTMQVNYPSFNIPEITGICTDGSILWDADLGPGYTYEWSTSETTPSITITTAGDYSVEITDAFLCSMTSDLITFTDDDYSETMSLGADINLCSGNFISLQVGAEETVSYSWPSATPSSQTMYEVDTTGNYFVQTTNVNGCVAQDTIGVIIVGVAPTAQFSAENVCFGLNSFFTDESSQAGAEAIISWEWDFGDEIIESNQNPTHLYTNEGEYEVVLTIEAEDGCQSVSSQTYTVYNLPVANFIYSGACSNQEIQFSNQSTTGSAIIDQFSWDFDVLIGGGPFSSVEHPLVTFDEVRNYTVQLHVVDQNGCENSHQQVISILESPSADFNIDLACANSVLPLENLSTSTVSPTYLWNFDDGTTAGVPNPSKVYANEGSYTISLLVTNANGCADSIQSLINVYPSPLSSFTIGPVCVGSYAEFSATSTIDGGTISDYQWEFNNSTNLAGDTVYHLIDVMGQNQVELTTVSQDGCSHTVSQFFDVTEQLDASFTIPLSINPVGYPVQFTNTSIGDFDSFWEFGTADTSIEMSPMYTFPKGDTTYSVVLIIENEIGCKDTSVMNLQIYPVEVDLELSSIYVQNSSSGKIVGVELKNLGSLTITSAEMKLLAREGLLLNEVWTGNLAPFESEIYLFSEAVSIENTSEDGIENYLCAEAKGYGIGGVRETNFENNNSCKNAEGEQVILASVYPNPAKESVTIQLIVTISTQIDLGLYDTRGRLIVPIIPSTEFAPGLYSFTIPTEQVGSGMYFIRLKTDEVTDQQKVMIVGE